MNEDNFQHVSDDILGAAVRAAFTSQGISPETFREWSDGAWHNPTEKSRMNALFEALWIELGIARGFSREVFKRLAG